MPRHPLPVVLLGGAMLIGLAGCSPNGGAPTRTATVAADGGGGASDASSGPPTAAAGKLTAACPLLTLKEAEKVVGVTLSAGVEGDPNDPSCSYEPDPNARTAQVRVITGADAKNTYDLDHDSLKHAFTDVPGLGDEAHQEDGRSSSGPGPPGPASRWSPSENRRRW